MTESFDEWRERTRRFHAEHEAKMERDARIHSRRMWLIMFALPPVIFGAIVAGCKIGVMIYRGM